MFSLGPMHLMSVDASGKPRYPKPFGSIWYMYGSARSLFLTCGQFNGVVGGTTSSHIGFLVGSMMGVRLLPSRIPPPLHRHTIIADEIGNCVF